MFDGILNTLLYKVARRKPNQFIVNDRYEGIDVGNKAKGRISKRVSQENKAR